MARQKYSYNPARKAGRTNSARSASAAARIGYQQLDTAKRSAVWLIWVLGLVLLFSGAVGPIGFIRGSALAIASWMTAVYMKRMWAR